MLDRFKSRVQEFVDVMAARYAKSTNGEALPERFLGVGAIMDNARFQICRPGESISPDADVQRAFYSAHTKSHNINMLQVVAPNGIRMCTVAGSGRHSDPSLVSPDLEVELEYLRLPILCDSIFAKTHWIRPIERFKRQTISKRRMKAISSIRIPVEWSFSYLKQDYPILSNPSKLKLYQSNPLALIKVAMLLANFKCCFRGENSSLYFDCLPPSFRDYVGFLV
jgi:hypothetical protein